MCCSKQLKPKDTNRQRSPTDLSTISEENSDLLSRKSSMVRNDLPEDVEKVVENGPNVAVSRRQTVPYPSNDVFI